MGVVARREMRPGAVIVAISLPLSCRNFLQPLLYQLVRYVVVLDVALLHPKDHYGLMAGRNAAREARVESGAIAAGGAPGRSDLADDRTLSTGPRIGLSYASCRIAIPSTPT
jgi:hypothetical protein